MAGKPAAPSVDPKNSSWNHGFQDNTDKEGIAVQGVSTRRVAAKEILAPDEAPPICVICAIRGF